ncbi:hypothetical protein [Streptomyces sp. Tue6028]|uniref:hypothetical protein n=1 Tax=Streptomyces sp. Tue6028 TaxID=2036037 RepID=UPI003D72C487
MDRDLTRAWWWGVVLTALVLGVLRLTAGYDGDVLSVLTLALLTSVAGVVPTHALAFAWQARGRRRVPGWTVCLAAAVLVSAALSLLASMVLMGLPHGADSALSWTDIRRRTIWIAGVLVPAAVGTYAVIGLGQRLRTRAGDRVRPEAREAVGLADVERPRTDDGGAERPRSGAGVAERLQSGVTGAERPRPQARPERPGPQAGSADRSRGSKRGGVHR